MKYNRLLLETAAVKGLKEEEYVRRGCRVTHGILPDEGEYYTVTEGADEEAAIKLLSCYIGKMAGEGLKEVLIVGLGNRGMTADALGNTVLSHLSAGGKPHFSLIAPQVSAVTGVESAEIISCVSERIKPDLTVLTDSLATSRYERLGRCYQLGNFAMIPGSGVGNSKRTKVTGRVISVGVPLVIKLGDLGVDKLKDYVVTPADIDEQVSKCGKVIALALEKALR